MSAVFGVDNGELRPAVFAAGLGGSRLTSSYLIDKLMIRGIVFHKNNF